MKLHTKIYHFIDDEKTQQDGDEAGDEDLGHGQQIF